MNGGTWGRSPRRGPGGKETIVMQDFIERWLFDPTMGKVSIASMTIQLVESPVLKVAIDRDQKQSD